MRNPRILIIGHARHGKDTVAGIISKFYQMTWQDSSGAAMRIFLYDALKGKYGYTSMEQCYEDRVNHRAEWFELICQYNQDDPTRLAREIMKTSDIYVGMRNRKEIKQCVQDGVFDFVVAVYDPRKPLEPSDSFDIEIGAHADFVILNDGDMERLQSNVFKMMNFLMVYHIGNE